MDVSRYLQTGLFQFGPVATRRQFFNLFGQQFVPATVVGASCILSASISLVAGSQWPERTASLLRVAPGHEVEDVIRTRVARVETRMKRAESIPHHLRLWVVADVGDLISTRWVSQTIAAGLCGAAFVDGAAAAFSRTDSEEMVGAWIESVGGEWRSAIDAGLTVRAEPPWGEYESWQHVSDEFLTLYERGLPDDKLPSADAAPWSGLIDLWRFEAYRISLMALSGGGLGL